VQRIVQHQRRNNTNRKLKAENRKAYIILKRGSDRFAETAFVITERVAPRDQTACIAANNKQKHLSIMQTHILLSKQIKLLRIYGLSYRTYRICNLRVFAQDRQVSVLYFLRFVRVIDNMASEQTIEIGWQWCTWALLNAHIWGIHSPWMTIVVFFYQHALDSALPRYRGYRFSFNFLVRLIILYFDYREFNVALNRTSLTHRNACAIA